MGNVPQTRIEVYKEKYFRVALDLFIFSEVLASVAEKGAKQDPGFNGSTQGIEVEATRATLSHALGKFKEVTPAHLSKWRENLKQPSVEKAADTTLSSLSRKVIMPGAAAPPRLWSRKEGE